MRITDCGEFVGRLYFDKIPINVGGGMEPEKDKDGKIHDTKKIYHFVAPYFAAYR